MDSKLTTVGIKYLLKHPSISFSTEKHRRRFQNESSKNRLLELLVPVSNPNNPGCGVFTYQPQYASSCRVSLLVFGFAYTTLFIQSDWVCILQLHSRTFYISLMDQKMPARRAHKKSRNGCFNCKKRKVKVCM